MSLHEYTHFTPGWGAVLLGTFVVSVLGLCAIVYPFYPDKPSAPRVFPGGLDRELGGRGQALIVS
jgi:NADH dehydrogenase (ubiquinone) 1 beta subcomplex subunit 8